MTNAADAIGLYAVIAIIAVFAHEPWRWLGLVFGRALSVDGEIFQWVRAVATALVAGLVVRLILFPAGTLSDVALGLRLGALAGSILIFFAFGRNLGAGVAGGAVLLIVGVVVSRQ